jgi:hypothetical protein
MITLRFDSRRFASAQTPALPAPRRGELRSSESIPPSPPYSFKNNKLERHESLGTLNGISEEFFTFQSVEIAPRIWML